MHIVFIDSICNPRRPGVGGVSDINWYLARELVRASDRVTVVGAYEEGVTSPYPGPELVVAPGTVVRRNNIVKHVRRAMRLARAARQVDSADVYHVPDSITVAALALLGPGNRVVWHGHSNVYHHAQHGIPWDRSMYELMRLATHFASTRIARVIALGPSLVPWWERSGFARERITVVPNGVDLSDEAAQVSEPLVPDLWSGHEHRLLYVGRLSAEKGGYGELIDAVEALSKSMSVGLLFLGHGPLRGELERKIEERGLARIVACMGHQPREVVQHAYATADLVVLPSRGEMMPRVMLEAWAAGVPFMASAVGAIPDYLVDGENGFLLASIEPGYLASRLREALGDSKLRAQVAERGKDTARGMSWTHTAARYRKVYCSVIRDIETQSGSVLGRNRR